MRHKTFKVEIKLSFTIADDILLYDEESAAEAIRAILGVEFYNLMDMRDVAIESPVNITWVDTKRKKHV